MILRAKPTHARAGRNAVSAIGALALVSAALTGCAPGPEPTSTPTPAFTSEAEAFAAAEEVYRAYNDAFNKIDLNNPSTFEPLFARSSGDFESADRKTLSELHAQGYRFVGQMLIVDFHGISASRSYRKIVAVVCIDVSNSDVVDASGNSATPQSRPSLNALRVTFVPDHGDLLIDHADREPDTSCEL